MVRDACRAAHRLFIRFDFPVSSLYPFSAQQGRQGRVEVPSRVVQCGARIFLRETHLQQLLEVLLGRRLRGVGPRPVPRGLLEQRHVVQVLLRHDRVLGVVGLWGAEKGLKGKERRLYSEGRGPLVLENVETDRTVLAAHVGVPDFALEPHLRWLKGVNPLYLNVHDEYASLIYGVLGPFEGPLEPGEVLPQHPHAYPARFVLGYLPDLLLHTTQVHPASSRSLAFLTRACVRTWLMVDG
mmetsp:Transcript_3184/g.8817  ORF Transcript_3184/g.8817 Transcript_3184/m.8817 type:complete len:240 (+) Transcript_3184:1030-1749(+)